MRVPILAAGTLAMAIATSAAAQAQAIEWLIERESKQRAGDQVQRTVESRWDGRSRSSRPNSYDFGKSRS